MSTTTEYLTPYCMAAVCQGCDWHAPRHGDESCEVCPVCGDWLYRKSGRYRMLREVGMFGFVTHTELGFVPRTDPDPVDLIDIAARVSVMDRFARLESPMILEVVTATVDELARRGRIR